MKKDGDKYSESARSVELSLMVSPKAMRLLQTLAARRDMSCEALAREYLTRGLIEDRLKAFAETATATVESVLREREPDHADALIAEVRRRFAQTA